MLRPRKWTPAGVQGERRVDRPPSRGQAELMDNWAGTGRRGQPGNAYQRTTGQAAPHTSARKEVFLKFTTPRDGNQPQQTQKPWERRATRSEHKAITLAISDQRTTKKKARKAAGKSRKIVLSNSGFKEGIKMEIRIYLVLEYNKNTVCQNRRNAAKTIVTRKFMMLNGYFRKAENV